MEEKKKRKQFSLREKKNIVKEIDKGDVAIKYRINPLALFVSAKDGRKIKNSID